MLNLCSWKDVLVVCKKTETLDRVTVNEVEEFPNNPIEWSAAHCGASAYPE
jgi:orotate phosphoribosyltransferase